MNTERVPPQNLEAEQSVLGAMLLEKEAIVRAAEILRPEDFYRDAHRQIFAGMLSLFEKGEAVDLVTLCEELRQQGSLEDVGGVSYITTLANLVPTAANVEYYARIVEEKAVLRQLIRTATDIVSRSYEGQEEIATLLDDAERRIMELSLRRSSQGFVRLKEVLMSTLDRLMQTVESGQATGFSSGYADLDHYTAGLQPSDLLILAARPSVGKTTFALNMARHVSVKHKVPVAIFSLEMSREQVAMRLLSAEAGVNQQKIRRGELEEQEWQALSRGLARLGPAPIFIDDAPALSVLELRSKTRRLRSEYGAGLVIVDYLQLLRPAGRAENRQQEISEISRNLKALARELKVPVLALSQLSRAVEQRQDRRPMLSDLRESGALEQDADVVMFLFTNAELERESQIEVIIAKQRNGPVGSVRMYFDRGTGLFMGLDTRHSL
ncbi:MAG TPA: replicative DNA helicase [Firmicutes bacterium]|nr:replicative DNA helicase [Bacillota bacterium]